MCPKRSSKPAALSDYELRFWRDELMGLWHWEAKTPDGKTLKPFNLLGIASFIGKENAETDALRRIERHMASETLQGDELQDRVRSRDSVKPVASQLAEAN